MPAEASTNPASTIGRRLPPRSLARSDITPAQGTSRSSSTLSMAITPPMAVRLSPSVSRTSSGTNVLSSGPVTPANNPPRPTMASVTNGVRRLTVAPTAPSATSVESMVDDGRERAPASIRQTY